MSDTPRTDALWAREYDPEDMAINMRDHAETLERELAAARKENDTLRGLLGNSAKDCIYCGLPATEQARCPQGFPGCSRSDDQMLSQHFADGYRANEAEKELAAATARIAELEAANAAFKREELFWHETNREVTARAESAERDALLRVEELERTIEVWKRCYQTAEQTALQRAAAVCEAIANSPQSTAEKILIATDIKHAILALIPKERT